MTSTTYFGNDYVVVGNFPEQTWAYRLVENGHIEVLSDFLGDVQIAKVHTGIMQKIQNQMLPNKMRIEFDDQQVELQMMANELAAEKAAAAGDMHRARQYHIMAARLRDELTAFQNMHMDRFADRFGFNDAEKV